MPKVISTQIGNSKHCSFDNDLLWKGHSLLVHSMSSGLVFSPSPQRERREPSPRGNTSGNVPHVTGEGTSLRISSTNSPTAAAPMRNPARTSPRYVETLNSSSAVFKHVLYEDSTGHASPTSAKRARGPSDGSEHVSNLKFDLRKIKVVSFDLDDTLWECESVIRKAESALHRFLQDRGHGQMVEHVTQPQLGAYQKTVYSLHPNQVYDVSFVRRKILNLAAKACHIEDETLVESAFQHFYYARTFHVSEHLFPGAVEAVARLKRLGLHIGTLTNGNADVLKVPELGPLVEHHVTPTVAGSAKPSPQIFEVLRSRFEGVAPDEVLHVGDSFESDVKGALNAGMKACWVVRDVGGGNEDDEILRVRHVADLADLFEEALLDLS
jgi:HAD superfamily hydrolase (TIGR01549 family)